MTVAETAIAGWRALPRLEAWPDRLISVIEWHRRHAFAWGRFDCATLFSDACNAVAGFDPADGATWQSERDAIAFLNRHDARSVFDFVVARFEPIPVALARRGDVGFTADRKAVTCPAIITGAEAVSRDLDGWISVPRDLLTVAFKVGI